MLTQDFFSLKNSTLRTTSIDDIFGELVCYSCSSSPLFSSEDAAGSGFFFGLPLPFPEVCKNKLKQLENEYTTTAFKGLSDTFTISFCSVPF